MYSTKETKELVSWTSAAQAHPTWDKVNKNINYVMGYNKLSYLKSNQEIQARIFPPPAPIYTLTDNILLTLSERQLSIYNTNQLNFRSQLKMHLDALSTLQQDVEKAIVLVLDLFLYNTAFPLLVYSRLMNITTPIDRISVLWQYVWKIYSILLTVYKRSRAILKIDTNDDLIYFILSLYKCGIVK